MQETDEQSLRMSCAGPLQLKRTSPSAAARTKIQNFHESMVVDQHLMHQSEPLIWKYHPPRMVCCINYNVKCKKEALHNTIKLLISLQELPLGKDYLESSSNKKELLTALFESSVIKTLILEITYMMTEGSDNIAGMSLCYHISIIPERFVGKQ